MPEERQWLTSPFLGGIILFTRNFQSKEQISQLIADVLSINPKLLITIDHEGGRVQRFREGFTQVPAMGKIGELAENDLDNAVRCAEAAGVVLGYELQQIGVHLTYAPVLDLNYGHNQVIGERSFGNDIRRVIPLASALMDGLKSLGMAVVAKHFPGHGWVKGDSHLVSPTDEREFAEIESRDMQPFIQLLDKTDWMMPAHIVFEKIAQQPAGFSPFWLQEVLRKTMAFEGPIVSDDLSMEGAAVQGSYGDRAQAAVSAGCNILLACNSASATTELLAWLAARNGPALDLSVYQPNFDLSALKAEYLDALATLKAHALL